MTVWSLGQISAVSGLESYQVIATKEMERARYPDAIKARMVAKAIRQFQEAARTYAVEVAAEDLRIGWEADIYDDEGTKGTELEGIRVHRVRVRWAPETLVAEMAGGPDDGTLLHMRDRLAQISCARSLSLSEILGKTESDAEVVPERYEYVLSGWHEQERRWVYTYRE